MSRTALVPGNADEQELIRLMDTYENLLLGLCIIILRDYHLAQDVVQETFLRAWRHGGLRPGMDEAVLVTAPDLTRLHLLTRLDEVVSLRSNAPNQPVIFQGMDVSHYDRVEYYITTESVPAETLLSMFAN